MIHKVSNPYSQSSIYFELGMMICHQPQYSIYIHIVSLLISIELFDSIQVTITIYFLEWNASQVALVI